MALDGGGLKIRAGNLWMRNMFAPDLAARGWEQVRHEFFRYGEEVVVPMGESDGLDAGNYKSYPDGNAFFANAGRPRDLYDSEVYEFARRRYDALPLENLDGALRHPGSTTANLTGAWYRIANVELPET
jgi:hypothetical protein